MPIICPRCGAVSHHPKDIQERYCGRCHQFHELMAAEPDRSAAHVVALHRQLRAFLIATMPLEAPDSIAIALMYELVSITATIADSEAQASALFDEWIAIARRQLTTYGVGRPHP